MKKALAGPAKRTAKKKPERRAMIAATRRRIGGLVSRLRGALSFHRFNNAPRGLANRVDRAANRLLVRAWPALARAGRRVGATALRWERRLGRWLRPSARLLFRALARLERLLLHSRERAVHIATRASSVLTPERAICLTILATAGCLAVAQFVDYRAVEIGQPGYAGLPSTSAPRVGVEAGGGAHAYLLLPVAALAAALALVVLRDGRRRGLGRIVFGLGLLSLAVALLVDLPAGQDAGELSSRFAGTTAVLLDGFYAQIAAAAGLMLGGLLLVVAPKAAARYHARPCRTRINSFARVGSALRRRRRRRASSQGRATRRGSRRRSGAVSAPASQR
jgi:hypothetical protein